MDTATLTRILGRTPECRLKLLELAREMKGPAWELSKKQRLELAKAADRASEHVESTRRLLRAMQSVMSRPSG